VRAFHRIRIFTFLCFCWANFGYGSTAKERKQIVFIVNPISHEIKNQNVEKLIKSDLDHNKYEYTIVYTQHANHATKLAHEALERSVDIIAAVGGDGTVNEVGKALVHTKGTLAIVSVGSGNGLARHLGIPIGIVRVVKALNFARSVTIDTAKINDRVFLGVAGVGVDAHIAQEFANFGKRGFFPIASSHLKNWQGIHLRIT